MKQNAIQTEKEMFSWLSDLISVFRCRREQRCELREILQKVKEYKRHPRRAELLQKYAEYIDSRRNSSSFHSASFLGFFNFVGNEFYN